MRGDLRLILVLAALLGAVLPSCRSRENSACLLSSATADDAGFAKVLGGFIVYTNRQVSDDGTKLEEVDRVYRVTGSFEFVSKERNGAVEYFVDVVTAGNMLYLGQLDRVYLEVYHRGGYVKVPVVAPEYELVSQAFLDGRKLKLPPEVVARVLAGFSQAPHLSTPATARAGREKSVRDLVKTGPMAALCPTNDGESCLGLDGLRTYRFKVALADFHMARAFREEMNRALADKDWDVIRKINWALTFLAERRLFLTQFASEASRDRETFLLRLQESRPLTFKAYSDFRLFQRRLLEAEKFEGLIEFHKFLDLSCPAVPAEGDEGLCQALAQAEESLVEKYYRLPGPGCARLSPRELMAVEGDTLKYHTCADEFDQGQWLVAGKSDETVISWERSEESRYVSLKRLMLAFSKSISASGLEKYAALVEAGLAEGVVPQAFSNFAPSRDADGMPGSDGLFFGGFNAQQAGRVRIVVQGQDYEFDPFSHVAALEVFPAIDGDVAGEEIDPADAVRSHFVSLRWKDDGFDNFAYCFQLGSHLSLDGLPFLALQSGCDQSGGAVIVPPPYAGNDQVGIDPGGADSGGGDGPVDEPDAVPIAKTDVTAARAPGRAGKNQFHAEDYHSDKSGNGVDKDKVPQPGEDGAAYSDNYRGVGDGGGQYACRP